MGTALEQDRKPTNSRSVGQDGTAAPQNSSPLPSRSLSYLLFTVTDGAVRMSVLLHAYQRGFSAMQVCSVGKGRALFSLA